MKTLRVYTQPTIISGTLQTLKAAPWIVFGILFMTLVCCGKKPAGEGNDQKDAAVILKYDEIALDPSKASQADRKALETFDRFQKNLQQQLMSAIKKSGPAGAIDVCRTASPQMEKEMSGEASLVRISDRPRNPEHNPRAVEAQVIELWAARLKAGQEIGPVAVTAEGARTVMRPIKIAGELCLKCHGSPEQIDGPTKEALKKAYPADQAVGYALNDLRGAFVARFPAGANSGVGSPY